MRALGVDMARVFTKDDGLIPVDLVHCALDHLSAAQALFNSSPDHYDSAGYLAHIGVEMLLKGWLLEVSGSFKGTHNIKELYNNLIESGVAQELDDNNISILNILDGYGKLRYPNLNAPIEVGDKDWIGINNVIKIMCRSLPPEIEEELSKINQSDKHEPVRKAGRVLIRKTKNGT